MHYVAVIGMLVALLISQAHWTGETFLAIPDVAP
jgi:hypothetical protein